MNNEQHLNGLKVKFIKCIFDYDPPIGTIGTIIEATYSGYDGYYDDYYDGAWIIAETTQCESSLGGLSYAKEHGIELKDNQRIAWHNKSDYEVIYD